MGRSSASTALVSDAFDGTKSAVLATSSGATVLAGYVASDGQTIQILIGTQTGTGVSWANLDQPTYGPEGLSVKRFGCGLATSGTAVVALAANTPTLPGQLAIEQPPSTGAYAVAFGALNSSAQILTWQTGPVTIPDRKAGKYGTAPAIALDDLGGFVVVYGINNVLYWSTGHVATSSTPWTVTIDVPPTRLCKGSYPRLTCHTGMLTLAYLDGSTWYVYPGSIVRAGDVVSVSWMTNSGTGVPGGTSGGTPSIDMVAEHELMVAGTVQARFGHLDCCTAFANWNPAVGSKWVKYSGRWGNEYSDPKVQFGSTSIREFSEPPRGPAYRPTWIAGP